MSAEISLPQHIINELDDLSKKIHKDWKIPFEIIRDKAYEYAKTFWLSNEYPQDDDYQGKLSPNKQRLANEAVQHLLETVRTKITVDLAGQLTREKQRKE